MVTWGRTIGSPGFISIVSQYLTACMCGLSRVPWVYLCVIMMFKFILYSFFALCVCFLNASLSSDFCHIFYIDNVLLCSILHTYLNNCLISHLCQGVTYDYLCICKCYNVFDT